MQKIKSVTEINDAFRDHFKTHLKRIKAAIKASDWHTASFRLENVTDFFSDREGLDVSALAEIKAVKSAIKAGLEKEKAAERAKIAKVQARVKAAIERNVEAERASAEKHGWSFDADKVRARGLGMKFFPTLGMFKAAKDKNTFDVSKCEARSYKHWVYVSRIKGKVVFNDYKYSVTTGGHQSDMRRLLESLGIKVHLFVYTHADLSKFETEALKEMYERRVAVEIAMTRKGTNPAKNLARVKEIKAIDRDMAKARALGAKLTRKEMAEIKAYLLESEKRRIAEMKEATARRAELNRQAKAALARSLDIVETHPSPESVADAEESALNNSFQN
jgi:hypothetical protein